jgi:hypothetical protein
MANWSFALGLAGLVSGFGSGGAAIPLAGGLGGLGLIIGNNANSPCPTNAPNPQPGPAPINGNMFIPGETDWNTMSGDPTPPDGDGAGSDGSEQIEFA